MKCIKNKILITVVFVLLLFSFGTTLSVSASVSEVYSDSFNVGNG